MKCTNGDKYTGNWKDDENFERFRFLSFLAEAEHQLVVF